MAMNRWAGQGETVGRKGSIEQLQQLCNDHVLVSIWGPAGIGKTRVAVEVAGRVDRPAHWIDCAALDSLEGLCAEIAERLDLRLTSAPSESVASGLETMSSVLLVLDSVDRLPSAALIEVRTWVEKSAVRALMTSRQRLPGPMGRSVELGPVSTETADGPSDAARLFWVHAGERAQEGEISPAEWADTERLVRLLEGLPLAIELAAARYELLGLTDLVDRLTERFDLLKRARGPLEESHCLWAAMDESWQMLSQEEQAVLRVCTVFLGGFSVELLEEVAQHEVLDALHTLRNRSMVRSVRPGRFDLYRSIREFVLETLEDVDTQAALRARHAKVFRRRARAMADAAQQTGRLPQDLVDERLNLGAAAEWALTTGSDELVEVLLCMEPLAMRCMSGQAYVDWITRGLEQSPHEPRLLRSRGRVWQTMGFGDRGQGDLAAALEGDPPLALKGTILRELGLIAHQRGSTTEAEALYRQALEVHRASNDMLGAAIAKGNLGALDHDGCRFEQAMEGYREAIDGFRRIGEVRHQGIFGVNLGVLEQEQGRIQIAQRHFQRALQLLEQSGDRRLLAIGVGNLAQLEHLNGNLDEAEAGYERATTLLQGLGDRWSLTLAFARLGAIHAHQGRQEEAYQGFDQADHWARQLDPRVLEVVRVYRAFIDLADGDFEAVADQLDRAVGGEEPLIERFDDARTACALLRRHLPKVSRRDALVVADDGRWFQLPGGTPQDIERFGAARRILLGLVAVRQQSEPIGLDLDGLFASGWPDTRLSADSVRNRVHVELARLRKLGLKTVLLRKEGFYLLDPAVTVELAPDP